MNSSFVDDDSPDSSPFLFWSDGTMSGPPAKELAQYEVCGMAIKCKHNAMPLSCLHSLSRLDGLWLPYVAVKECYKHSQLPALVAEFFLSEFGLPYDREKLLKGELLPFENVKLHTQARIRAPNGKVITRIICMARWKDTDDNCCKDTLRLNWIPIDVMLDWSKGTKQQKALLDRIWGSEVTDYAGLLNATELNQMTFSSFQYIEQSTDQVFKYVKLPLTDDEDPPSPVIKMYMEFVNSAKFTEWDVAKVYSDFLQHCYPSIDMSFTSFRDYCRKINLSQWLDVGKLARIFRAMNYKVKNFIGFNEFLLGIVALDPDSAHQKPRYTFVFRYFDSDSDGALDVDDIKLLKADLPKDSNNPDLSSLDFDQFSQAIDSDQLKGTETLCRIGRSILRLIHEANVYDLIGNKDVKPFGDELMATCERCCPRKFILGTHSVRLLQSGEVVEPKVVVNVDRADTKMAIIQRQHSLDYVFKPTCNANYVLNKVRKLANLTKLTEPEKREVRNEVTSALSQDVIYTLLDQVSELLSFESRVLELSTPTVVLGDTHGNIHDLLIFETQLWQMAPSAISTNFLFLGDYVDRGEFGLEVVCYLFAMKVLAPNKFFLLRGNHEVRNLQRAFTFEKECKHKYGERLGADIWERLNQVFDQLPFAAVIDGSIYCAHGGIPFSLETIEELKRLPTSIADPEFEAPAVWEILWSDPITDADYKRLAAFMNKREDTGFLPNMKRSTANYYSEKATSNFLKRNNLSHVIRAHEVINEGYRFNHHGQVLTIFSCSRYCGGVNKAAAIMVEAHDQDGLIKIMSLDT